MNLCPCGNRATHLCDTEVEAPLSVEEVLRRIRAGDFAAARAPATCDAPLCADCRVQVGNIFACSRGGRKPGCAVESVDRCPTHAPPPALKIVRTA